MPDPKRAGEGLAECCVRYVRHVMDSHIELAQLVRENIGSDDTFGISSFLCAMDGRDHAGDRLGLTLRDVLDIVEGRRLCPWHDRVPEDYLAAMRALGGPDERV